MPGLAWAQNTDWKPATLSATQNDTVIVLTDLIIPETDTPGARAANVNRYIDLLLTDGSTEVRNQFLSGLGALDRLAAETHRKPFRECTAAQQTALLTQASEEKTSKEVSDFFRLAKSLTSRIYYNTAIGFRELNKGGRVPKTFACTS